MTKIDTYTKFINAITALVAIAGLLLGYFDYSNRIKLNQEDRIMKLQNDSTQSAQWREELLSEQAISNREYHLKISEIQTNSQISALEAQSRLIEIERQFVLQAKESSTEKKFFVYSEAILHCIDITAYSPLSDEFNAAYRKLLGCYGRINILGDSIIRKDIETVLSEAIIISDMLRLRLLSDSLSDKMIGVAVNNNWNPFNSDEANAVQMNGRVDHLNSDSQIIKILHKLKNELINISMTSSFPSNVASHSNSAFESILEKFTSFQKSYYTFDLSVANYNYGQHEENSTLETEINGIQREFRAALRSMTVFQSEIAKSLDNEKIKILSATDHFVRIVSARQHD